MLYEKKKTNSCGSCIHFYELEPIRTGEQPTTLGSCWARNICYSETKACKWYEPTNGDKICEQ